MKFGTESRTRNLILTVCSTVVVLTIFGRTVGFFEKEKGLPSAVPAAMATTDMESRT